MMSHGLRPQLALSRRCFTLKREASAGTDTDVAVKVCVKCYKVTKLISRHAVVLEDVVYYIDSYAGLFVLESLMSCT
jgi:hypothetical protein